MSAVANGCPFRHCRADGDVLQGRMMQDQHPDLEWRDGAVPVATQFHDPYFSLLDGLAETKHVFLAGNDLPERFCDGFHVAELGFGTGLNFLATWAAWRETGIGGTIKFTTFEAYPMRAADMVKALTSFPTLKDLAVPLLEAMSEGGARHTFDGIELDIVYGDARKALPQWDGIADAWYLDGFSPAKNPELWGPELLAGVARHTSPNGTAATYTAAGFVRRGLQDAGFVVDRVAGFGGKRHMTRAKLP